MLKKKIFQYDQEMAMWKKRMKIADTGAYEHGLGMKLMLLVLNVFV